MTRQWYPWLRASYEQILASHQAGRAHHALLIHSLPGMGEQSLTYAISRWLMCQQPDGLKSCGHCRACQLMQAGTYPDYYTLQAEAAKNSIGIDAIRQLTDKLYEHASRGGGKLVCLPQAEQLTEAAVNALLKTLEEPPQNTWFLLNCHQPQRLPATLRSRCAYCYLPAPATNYALNWLARETQAAPLPLQSQLQLQLHAALRLSDGAPLAALQLMQPASQQARQQLCDGLRTVLTAGDWYSLLALLDDEQVDQRLHWLSSLLLDAVKYQQGAGNWLTNPDQATLIGQLAEKFTSLLLHWIIQTLLHSRQQLRSIGGLNRELMLADSLLQIERCQQPDAIIPPLHQL